MKSKILLLFCLFLTLICLGAEKFYEVKENKGGFPLPYMVPDFKEGDEQDFDWERYFAEAVSEADRVYRKHLAYWEFGHRVDARGVGDSSSDEMFRANLAAKEFKAKCDELVRRYRKKLEPESTELELLNEFISSQERVIEIQVKLVGGSWWGGSGARVAYAQSTADAYLGFLTSLNSLGSSLHLQDLPK